MASENTTNDDLEKLIRLSMDQSEARDRDNARATNELAGTIRTIGSEVVSLSKRMTDVERDVAITREALRASDAAVRASLRSSEDLEGSVKLYVAAFESSTKKRMDAQDSRIVSVQGQLGEQDKELAAIRTATVGETSPLMALVADSAFRKRMAEENTRRLKSVAFMLTLFMGVVTAAGVLWAIFAFAVHSIH